MTALAAPGTPQSDLDTPRLCIDLDVMESNIQRMASFMAERGKQWRPHEKCHKTPEIARRQREAGAIGVTCAKVSEAEVMAAGGTTDILIANMIVGAPKVRRVAQLCQTADPIVAVDHFAQAQPLAAACHEAGVTCRVILEINVGLDRVGVLPGRDAIELARATAELDGLELVGIMGYEGHLLRVEDPDEKRTQIEASMKLLEETRDAMRGEGLCCDIVSAGGTGSYQYTSDCPAVTELQAGGGIFADPMYQLQMGVTGLEYGLTVLATVVSRPEKHRAVLDSGRKTLSPDAHLPLVKNHPETEVVRMSAEHCELQLAGDAVDLTIGDKIELIVGYADFTTVLHDHFFACRGGVLEEVWEIAGRGKLQ
ncbi:MAG: DSD1 family PLP-dependent enzyme [Planctomycetota bacterium]|nr:DSD1 family PLP-dependent enzyme [Planctomycetota bacterium]MED5399248.1 DSD1 family PLP-dependent enzyme [Planctomycetota bacterium]MEE3285787.1 DSD1 family PLP-dependent enzyme [Planctomycetota bacterium]